MPPSLNELAARLRLCRHLVILTGAGVSQESGIPTFRDTLTGLWSQFEAERLATPAAFKADPALVWSWYEWRRAQVLACEPNAAHAAIAELAHRVPRLTLITQNVDRLHQRAGSPEVLELHGSLHRPCCHACRRPYALTGPPPLPDEGQRLPPLRCAHCGGRIRPGVVWFGEMLPANILKQAEAAARDGDLFLSVGTSALVYPAAGLPWAAAEAGVLVAQINPDTTPLDSLAAVNLQGTAAQILPELVARAFQRHASAPS